MEACRRGLSIRGSATSSLVGTPKGDSRSLPFPASIGSTALVRTGTAPVLRTDRCRKRSEHSLPPPAPAWPPRLQPTFRPTTRAVCPLRYERKTKKLVASLDYGTETKCHCRHALARCLHQARQGTVIQVGRKDLTLRGRSLMEPWNLFVQGRFTEAVNAFTKRLRRDKRGPNYCNRGMRAANLGDYDKAPRRFPVQPDGCFKFTSDGYLQFVGVSHWLAGRESEAVTGLGRIWCLQWNAGKSNTRRARAVRKSACLLWFAAVRLKPQGDLLGIARARLWRKKVKRRTGRNWSINNWPGSIAKFLIGQLDEKRSGAKVIDMPVPCASDSFARQNSTSAYGLMQLWRRKVAAKRAFQRSRAIGCRED